MTDTIESLTHHIIKNTVDALSNTDNELTELQSKYEKLLAFVQHVKDSGCSLIAGEDCLSCAALDILREIKK
jgi:hypothetical protein